MKRLTRLNMLHEGGVNLPGRRGVNTMKGKGLLINLAAVLFVWQPAMAGAQSLTVGSPVKGYPPTNLPMQAAEKVGFWKNEGLKVHWVVTERGGAAELHQAVAAGAVDVGTSGSIPLVQAVAAGVQEVIIADLGWYDNTCIWVTADSPIKEPKELKGATIASGHVGELTYALGMAIARGFGLEKDIKFISGAGTRTDLAAMKTRKIQGRVGVSASHIPLKVMGEIRDVACAGQFLPRRWLDRTLFARKAFLEKERPVVQKALRAIFASVNYIMDNPGWTLELLKKEYGYSEAAAQEVVKMISYSRDGKLDLEGLRNVIDFMIQNGLVAKEKVPPLEVLVSKEFVR